MNEELEYKFETTDVLGRNVKLKQSTWDYHIINEHEERTHFTGKEKFFENIVEDPDLIHKQKAKGNKDRWNYSAYGTINGEGNPKIYNVIVEESSDFTHYDVVTIMEKSNTRVKPNERDKEAIVYARRKEY
ncbi:hypothetical protein [Mammaliicoccus sciuri]|uniref:hypothetical protein n=1 Tax=Mammaliicoccus sciuri TaxID=1296 RepID=UPI002DBFBAEE|nr:hypothetical protein [Mammaliicoccus sciuri]MEB6122793.1 hypothetical protein [Mammaliicoccus sciuri]MEB6313022.1 hypothetical protein [Mammaliicoccus sciuri]MEB6696528.1 hypothetical protein [Mammaliicoccus sciuri]